MNPRLFLAAVSILVLVPAFPAPAAVAGDAVFLDERVSVWADAQVLGQFVEPDNANDLDGRARGVLRRVQAGLVAKPWDFLALGLTLEYNDFDPPVLEGDTSRFIVPEAWAELSLPYTIRIKAGHFAPPWTLDMPKRPGDLDFIRYPLIVDSGQLLFTPWRQTGVLASVDPNANMRFALGFFHGMDLPDAYLDDNNKFDAMFVASLGLFPGFRFNIGYWGGRGELRTETLGPGEFAGFPYGLSRANTTNAKIDVGGGVIDTQNTWVGGEYGQGGFRIAAETIWNRADRDGDVLRKTWGYHLSALYSYEWFSTLLRYEYLDPDTADQGGGGEEFEWTTLGIAATPAPWARFSLNYIFKTERSPNQVHNNELLLQATVRL